MPRKIVDITGQRFGRLVAVRCVGVGGSRMLAQWECKCDCGKTVVVCGAELRNGNRKSCGCSRKQPRKPKADACIVCGSPIIKTRNMCARCYMIWWNEKRQKEMERYL